jgi:predicted S18 family serine protease
MKWAMITAVMTLAIQSAQADVTDANFLNHLLLEKTKAEALVQRLKIEFEPKRSEYVTGRQKYIAAQQAFNNYTNAMLSNYRVGNKVDLKETAQLAASRAKDFENYVSSLPSKGVTGFTAIFVAVGVLIEVGDKLFNFIQKHIRDDRARTADEIARQVTWDDWDKIRS